jgi:hypothetical protein
MTLQELDRLIRRIEEAIERPPADGVLPRLAADYAAACRAAAQRLGQCATMLSAGDEHQALQLAEAAPALLDQLTLLSFRRSPNFRALCQSQNLPVPESFDIRGIRQINDLYAKGIDKDHVLYREYRRAVMVNDDARALAVLRSITRLNQNDKNAAAELARLEQKFVADKIQKLDRFIREKAPARDIASLTEELENIPEAQQSSAWIPAQTIRGSFLVEQAREAQRAAAVDDLQQILGKIPNVAHLLGKSDREAVDEMEHWSAADAARRKEAASRRTAILQLTETVSRIEQEQTSQRNHSLQDLRKSADTLERAWRQVEHFRAEIAGDIATRAQKLRDTLRLQIDRSLRASRRMALAAVGLIVAACFAAAWFSYTRQSSRALAARLHEMIQQRQVTEVETGLASSSEYANTRVLIEAREEAARFVKTERDRQTAINQRIDFLEQARQKNFANFTTEQIATNYQSLKKGMATLPAEFGVAAVARLTPFETAWREHLDQQRNAASARLSEILTPIESAADRYLQYSREPSQVAASAAALQKQLEPANSLVHPSLPDLRPKQEVLFRFENLQTRIEKFARDATNWFVSQRALDSATNLAAYNSALQLLATNGFTPQAQRASVAALASLNLSDQNLIAPLLLPNGPASALNQPPRASRLPDEVLPAEREIQRRLRDDENIQAISRLEIEIKSLPAENPRRRRTVYLRGELQRRITRRAGLIYDPIESPNALQFEPREMSSLDYTVEEPTPTPEHELYDRAGLSRLIDSNTGKYQTSLLQALDEINQDRRASPLFRAWLFMQICEMIDAQPAPWGAIWSPAYAADRADLERLGARQIHSDDWFVPAANTQRAAALYAYFDRAAIHSYSRQSAFFKRLLPRAAETGLRVIGHIDANGEPLINDTRAYAAVYAITAPNEPPQIVFTNLSPNRRPQPLAPAMPFSPLLAFAGNAAELINSTLQELGYSAAAVNLPESLPPILRTP